MAVFIRKHNKLNLQKIRKPKSFVSIRVLAFFVFLWKEVTMPLFMLKYYRFLGGLGPSNW